MSSFRPPLLSRSGREPVFREGAFDDFVRFSLVSVFQHEEPTERVWARIESHLCADGSPLERSLRERFGQGLSRFTSQLVHVLFYDPSLYERLDERKLQLTTDIIGWPGSAILGLAGV